MEFVSSIVAGVVLGLAARRKGLNGLQWGIGIALLLLLVLALLGSFGPALAAKTYVWWIIAVPVVAFAGLRLSSKPTPASPVADGPPQAPGDLQPATFAATAAEPKKPLWLRSAQTAAPVLGLLIAGAIYQAVSGSGSTPMLSGSHASQYLVQPASSDPAQLASATSTRLPEDMPIVSWKDQGFGYSDRTRIFFRTDTFGKISAVYVEQLGILSLTGQVHPIPKFALRYRAAIDHGDGLQFAGINGPSKPARLSFDDSSEYIEMTPEDGDLFAAQLNGKVGKGMKSASTLKVNLGASAAGGEISLQYDLVDFRQAVGFALAALGTTPTSH